MNEEELKKQLEKCNRYLELKNSDNLVYDMLDIFGNNEMVYEYIQYANNLFQENKQLKQMVNYQKSKFIDYLNGSILSYNVIANGIEDSDYKEEIMAKIRTFNEVLINYKHIIGDDNNE